ncbi:MAG: DedA family protein [Thermoanaerobaculia bacterium]
MDLLGQLFDLFLHLDRHLLRLVETYGAWTYLILGAVVLLETGLVVTPFLPGDSLLFAAGAFAAAGVLELPWLLVLLSAAAIVGDTANYWIGYAVRRRLAERGRLPFVKPAHLERTHAFYEKYGAKTIILARFVPIVRTFAPFVAGVGTMTYGRFMTYNVVGGIGWVLVCTLLGYFFGNLPLVQENFSLVILAIIVVSLVPAVVEVLRARRERAAAADSDGRT